ncbi:hypothetical protein ACFE04_026268 [Oxalis oulophora]
MKVSKDGMMEDEHGLLGNTRGDEGFVVISTSNMPLIVGDMEGGTRIISGTMWVWAQLPFLIPFPKYLVARAFRSLIIVDSSSLVPTGFVMPSLFIVLQIDLPWELARHHQ